MKTAGLIFVMAVLVGLLGYVLFDLVVSPAATKVSTVNFNQNFIEDSVSQTLNLNDPIAVFGYVFAQLEPEVKVYPTENYYYFSFYQNQRLIKGNIRLDVLDRQDGKVDFAYFAAHNRPRMSEDMDETSVYRQLGTEEGVELQQIDRLNYRVSYQGKTVVFRLNDLTQAVPGGMVLAEGEEFLARTEDESGWKFLLVLDTDQPQFRFIADISDAMPEKLELYKEQERVYLGRNSGFVFYQDELGRNVLVAVDGDNVRKNSYYDGPFDQLADNFVGDDRLKEALESVYPYVKGRINQYGMFLDNQGGRLNSRVAISPYANYSNYEYLDAFLKNCEQKGESEREKLLCLTYDYKQAVPLSF